MKKILNALFIKNVKANPLQVTDFSDAEIDSYGATRKGFIFRISPRGLKTWVARLKHQAGEKQGYYYEKRIGSYPAMELSEARTTFDQWKYHGVPEAKMTVNNLCDRYISEWSKPNKRVWQEDQRQLDKDVRPAIGTKPIDEVTKQDIKAILNEIHIRGAPCMANITLALLRKVFNWAVDEDLLENNPCYRLKAFPVKHHSSYLNEAQLKTFLTNLPTSNIPETMQKIYTLQLQTVTRISEVRGLRWCEIDFNHDTWTIPIERSKTKIEHRILLSKQSIRLLQAREGNGSAYVFPDEMDIPYRLDVVIKWLTCNREHLGMPERAATHSLRHAALTQLASMGCGRELRDRMSNHKNNSMDALYVHYEYDIEAKDWWQQWADRISLWSRPQLKVVVGG